jgi:hypothetical protein
MITLLSLEPVTLETQDTRELKEQQELIIPNFDSLDLDERSKYALYELANHEVVTNAFMVEKNCKLSYLASKLCPLPVNIAGLLFPCRIHYRHGNSKSNQTDTNTTRGHQAN